MRFTFLHIEIFFLPNNLGGGFMKNLNFEHSEHVKF